MTVERMSTLTVRGNPNPNMQAAYDAAHDTRVVIPTNATHVEIHRGSAPFQKIWWSWYGTAGTWRVLQAPSRLPMGQFRSGRPPTPPEPATTDVYLRKPLTPRFLSSWEGVNPGKAGVFSGGWDASTNTPTLVNGTGSDKQYYYVTGAGAVDFGAGPIAFVVGDWVIYDASLGEWLKAAEDPRKSLVDDRIVEVTVSFTQD
jgi:hypothetical protein